MRLWKCLCCDMTIADEGDVTKPPLSPTCPRCKTPKGQVPLLHETKNTSVVQNKMLNVLSDGLPHTREELFACLDDDLSQLSAIWAQISLLRRRLRPIGEDIICETVGRGIHYRHVRLLRSPNAE